MREEFRTEVLLAWIILGAVVVALARALRARGPGPTHAGPWMLAFQRLRQDRRAMLALSAIAIVYIIAILAPLLAPYDPTRQLDIIALKNRPPSLAHPFGTDPFGRDVLSRVIHGAQVSLGIAFIAIVFAMTVGTAYGAIAGWAGGRLDGLMMRINDAMLSIPRVLLLIAVLSLWGQIPVPALAMLLGLTGWFSVSRIVRAEVLALREQEFVVSARALGARDLRVLLRHVLPNVLSPVLVAATLGIGNVIALEAGLSYLGIGVRPPSPSWGNIIHDAGGQVSALWWVSLFPGLAIVLTVMAFNALGDGLRDALDPRQLPPS